MTVERACEILLHVFCDRKTITPEMLREIRKVQTSREEPESEALCRVAGFPYPGWQKVKSNPESIRLLVSAYMASRAMEEAS